MTRLLGWAIACVVAAAGCGGDEDPFCGDGTTDDGEQCDDGNDDETDNCRACESWVPPMTTVKWRFNADAAPGFMQDGCNDTRTSRVTVTLTPGDITLDAMCSNFQVTFSDLPPRVYTATLTPLDSDGNSLVTAPVTAELAALADGNAEVTINVPPEAWIGPYTGTFFFTVRWAPDSGCVAAGVTQQVITLAVDGAVVTQMTTTGQSLDGDPPGPCVEPDNPSPQAALTVPFGPATIEISGLDMVGTAIHVGSFDTFVGAGPSNPTLEFVVPSIYDAMPIDAMP